ncbi:MAG: prepilin-type N-terminal cleavage/methylation domain-containing protein [Acidobacteria bacterium]|nr:prepilin-type N-terminal cleavage/methylation domain-containing protein [Acidobacteriota bacterium]
MRTATNRGFTLIELLVILGVLAVLAAAVAPAFVQQIGESRIQATQDEARVLYESMVGPSSGETRFGFVGDIGRLPTSFQELAQQGSLPSYTTATERSIGMGWRGPYVNVGTSATDYLNDGFGRPYTGASSGQVRSAGTDGVVNTADDIVYPPAAPTITGSIIVTVKTTQGQKTIVDPVGYHVDVYYAADGSQTSVSASTAPFSFSNIPMGLHAVRVVKTSNPGAGNVVAQDTVIVRPGGTAAVELWF